MEANNSEETEAFRGEFSILEELSKGINMKTWEGKKSETKIQSTK